jgi:hypothetical protein
MSDVKTTRILRNFETLLTDQELAACGLAAISRPKSYVLSRTIFGDDIKWKSDALLLSRSGGYESVLRDQSQPTDTHADDWHERFSRRMDELAEIADEEDLPLSKASCDAVAKFVKELDGACRAHDTSTHQT